MIPRFSCITCCFHVFMFVFCKYVFKLYTQTTTTSAITWTSWVSLWKSFGPLGPGCFMISNFWIWFCQLFCGVSIITYLTMWMPTQNWVHKRTIDLVSLAFKSSILGNDFCSLFTSQVSCNCEAQNAVSSISTLVQQASKPHLMSKTCVEHRTWHGLRKKLPFSGIRYWWNPSYNFNSISTRKFLQVAQKDSTFFMCESSRKTTRLGCLHSRCARR